MGIAIGSILVFFSLSCKIFETIIDHFKVKKEIEKDLQPVILYHYFKYKENCFLRISIKSQFKRIWERLFIFSVPLMIFTLLFFIGIDFKLGIILIIIYFLLMNLIAYLHDSYLLFRDLINGKNDDFPNYYILNELLKYIMDDNYYDMERVLISYINRDSIKASSEQNQGLILLYALTYLGLGQYEDSKEFFDQINEGCDERIKLLHACCLHCLGKYHDSIELLNHIELNDYQDCKNIIKCLSRY